MNVAMDPRHMHFGLWYFRVAAVIIALIVVAGFLPNYVLRMLHDRRDMTVLVQMHGLVMAAWIALFVAQTTLVAKHRVDLHRKLGVAGGALLCLMPLIGVPVLVNAAARQAHQIHGKMFYLMLVAFDGISLLLAVGLAAAALVMRRRSDIHKRLMLLATLTLLGPAFGRLTSYANGFRGDSDLAVLLLMLASLFACVGIDTWRQRQWHPIFVWGGASVIAADLLTYLCKTCLA